MASQLYGTEILLRSDPNRAIPEIRPIKIDADFTDRTIYQQIHSGSYGLYCLTAGENGYHNGNTMFSNN